MFCGYCGKEVTEDCRFCGSCGKEANVIAPPRPAQPAKRGIFYMMGRHWILTLLTLFAITIFLVFLVRSSDNAMSIVQSETPEQKAAEAAAQQKAQAEELSVEAAADAARRLRESMRDPDSFKVAQVLVMPDGGSCFEYRSRNGFGGMDAEQAVLKKNGDIITTEQPGFDNAWNKECAGKTGEDVTWLVK